MVSSVDLADEMNSELRLLLANATVASSEKKWQIIATIAVS